MVPTMQLPSWPTNSAEYTSKRPGVGLDPAVQRRAHQVPRVAARSMKPLAMRSAALGACHVHLALRLGQLSPAEPVPGVFPRSAQGASRMGGHSNQLLLWRLGQEPRAGSEQSRHHLDLGGWRDLGPLFLVLMLRLTDGALVQLLPLQVHFPLGRDLPGLGDRRHFHSCRSFDFGARPLPCVRAVVGSASTGVAELP